MPRRNLPVKAATREPNRQELGEMRTIPLPSLPKQTGSAEFFLLVSRKGIETAKTIGQSPAFENAALAIQSASYQFPFPDQGPEKLIRRAVLSCSLYTKPSCEITLLLPSDTSAPAHSPNNLQTSQPNSAVTAPSLVSKTEPEYTPAALAANLEGTVVLAIVIDEQGVPEAVSVVKSLGMGLDENAKECIRKWRFHPGTKDGKPVTTNANVEISFRLQQAEE